MGSIQRFIQIVGSLLAILALLAAGALVYPIPYISDYVKRYIAPVYDVSIVVVIILGVLLLAMLVGLLQAIFYPSKRSRLAVATEAGELFIHKNVIEKAVYDGINDIPNIRNPQVKAKAGNQPEKTKVIVDFEILETEDVLSAGNEVQHLSRQAVEDLLGVSVSEVIVNVKQLDLDTDNKRLRASAGPRVR